MTQFKDKSAKNEDNINAGLFTYPVLMAADILLYQADLVPVGVDQKQHLEIAREIAERFNNLYGETFKIPDGYIPKAGAKIMGLQNPENKMSKSDDNPNDAIFLTDNSDIILKKFKKAVTDSVGTIKYEEGRPGINNLINIYSCVTGKTIESIEKEFDGAGYGTFKEAIAEAVISNLAPLQNKYKELLNNKDYLYTILEKGKTDAKLIAEKTLQNVKEKIGLITL